MVELAFPGWPTVDRPRESLCPAACRRNVTAIGDDGYRAVVGDRLEIVPVGNPAAARIGDEIAFKVLFEGKPLATPVFATYDRFSESEDHDTYLARAVPVFRVK